jgi:hypothetical protein
MRYPLHVLCKPPYGNFLLSYRYARYSVHSQYLRYAIRVSGTGALAMEHTVPMVQLLLPTSELLVPTLQLFLPSVGTFTSSVATF